VLKYIWQLLILGWLNQVEFATFKHTLTVLRLGLKPLTQASQAICLAFSMLLLPRFQMKILGFQELNFTPRRRLAKSCTLG
jgi:hypothetical protein